MKPLPTADDLRQRLVSLADPEQAAVLQRFFQTGPGQYAEGDRFLGLRVPQTREAVGDVLRLYAPMPPGEVERLLLDPYHEVRLAGLLTLVAQYRQALRQGADEEAERILRFYLLHAHLGNNWDLVDTVCPHILGTWLCLETVDEGEKLRVMDSLACSDNLWRQRISVVAGWMPLRHGRPDFTLRYAERHLHHPHHLMHKAVGWMLREMGKQVSLDLLRSFLRAHAQEMPRTMLRYAIERMSPAERQEWLRCRRV